MRERSRYQNKDSAIYGILGGFLLLGGIAFMFITILALVVHAEIIDGVTWWWSLIISILCFMMGFTFFDVMTTFDNIYTRIENLEKEKKSE